jgi:hypothetical protein
MDTYNSFRRAFRHGTVANCQIRMEMSICGLYIETEATAEEAAELWLATYVLIRMRFVPSVAGALLR